MSTAPPIQLWLADLAHIAPALEALDRARGILAPEEREWLTGGLTAGGTKGEPNQHEVTRAQARIALRLLLAGAGARDAFGKPFAVRPGGKPGLASGAASFSVSHSDQLVLVAIGQADCDVGIDLERARAIDMPASRRAHLLAAAEAMAGGAAKARDNQERMISAWTRLEALAKAQGCGIGRLLTELDLTAEGAKTRSLEETSVDAHAWLMALRLTVRDLDLPAGLFGAVAVRGALPEAPPVTRLGADSAALLID